MGHCDIEARRGYLEASGVRLSYLEWAGAGPVALLLHGITSSAATFWRIGAALAEAGFHVFVLDMPGHGESAISPRHEIDAIAGLVGAAIEQLGLRDITLIGHSWGGATALALASGAHPAKPALARVALLDPALAMTPEWGQERLPSFKDGLGQPAASHKPVLRANNPDWHECDIHWKAQAMEQCHREQVEGFFVGSGEWSLVERAGQVDVPLLVLVADPAFTVIPAERLNELEAALRPGLSRIIQVPGTTHNMLRGAGYAATMAALMGWMQHGAG